MENPACFWSGDWLPRENPSPDLKKDYLIRLWYEEQILGVHNSSVLIMFSNENITFSHISSPSLHFFFSCNFSPMTWQGTSLTLLRKWQPFLCQKHSPNFISFLSSFDLSDAFPCLYDYLWLLFIYYVVISCLYV